MSYTVCPRLSEELVWELCWVGFPLGPSVFVSIFSKQKPNKRAKRIVTLLFEGFNSLFRRHTNEKSLIWDLIQCWQTLGVEILIFNPPSFGGQPADICFVPVHWVFVRKKCIFLVWHEHLCCSVVDIYVMVCVCGEVVSWAAVKSFPEDLGAGTWPCEDLQSRSRNKAEWTPLVHYSHYSLKATD